MKDLMKCFEGSPSQSLIRFSRSSITFKVTSYFSVAKKCSRMCGARAGGFPGLFFSLSNGYFFMALPKSSYLPRLPVFFFFFLFSHN